MLLEEGGTNSLAARSALWASASPKTTGAGSGKRKAVPGSSTKQEAGAKGGPGPGGGGTPSRSRLVAWGNPAPSACGYTWSGGSCPRIGCQFAHDQVSPALRAKTSAVAGNKNPTPPLHPPPHRSRNNSPPAAGPPEGLTEEGAGRRVLLRSLRQEPR